MTACFIDTNLFIRYLTNDDPGKADRVERLLAEAAAGKHQPDPPIPFGRTLALTCPEGPVEEKRHGLSGAQSGDEIISQSFRKRGEPSGMQALHAHPPRVRTRRRFPFAAAPAKTDRDAARGRRAPPFCRRA